MSSQEKTAVLEKPQKHQLDPRDVTEGELTISVTGNIGYIRRTKIVENEIPKSYTREMLPLGNPTLVQTKLSQYAYQHELDIISVCPDGGFIEDFRPCSIGAYVTFKHK